MSCCWSRVLRFLFKILAQFSFSAQCIFEFIKTTLNIMPISAYQSIAVWIAATQTKLSSSFSNFVPVKTQIKRIELVLVVFFRRKLVKVVKCCLFSDGLRTTMELKSRQQFLPIIVLYLFTRWKCYCDQCQRNQKKIDFFINASVWSSVGFLYTECHWIIHVKYGFGHGITHFSLISQISFKYEQFKGFQ